MFLRYKTHFRKFKSKFSRNIFFLSLLFRYSQVGKIRKTAARRREYHILFMVLTTAACYLLCWMPYGVVAMMATFGPPNIISPVASVVPSLLAKSSTVINPLIYILMNKQVSRYYVHVRVLPKIKSYNSEKQI